MTPRTEIDEKKLEIATEEAKQQGLRKHMWRPQPKERLLAR